MLKREGEQKWNDQGAQQCLPIIPTHLYFFLSKGKSLTLWPRFLLAIPLNGSHKAAHMHSWHLRGSDGESLRHHGVLAGLRLTKIQKMRERQRERNFLLMDLLNG